MIVFLADHDVEGHAKLIFGALNAEGWLDLVPAPQSIAVIQAAPGPPVLPDVPDLPADV